MSEPRAAGPGRVLVILCDSGWREYSGRPPGYSGELILPYPQGLTGRKALDMGVHHDVHVWSITDPRWASG